MRLRGYTKDDASVIAGWIRSEEEMYKWSADRINRYPISGEDIDGNYSQQMESGRFHPFMAVDDAGRPVGHFIIRYPQADDDSSVRFGFVIVDPAFRGKGCGREMLRLGLLYAAESLHARRVDLGVFEGNESARRCYASLGFREYGRRACTLPLGTWTCIDMELFICR